MSGHLNNFGEKYAKFGTFANPGLLPTRYVAYMKVTKVSICEWANGPFYDRDVKVV